MVEDACRAFYAAGCLDALRSIIMNEKEDAMARIKACEQIAKVGRVIQPETQLTMQDKPAAHRQSDLHAAARHGSALPAKRGHAGRLIYQANSA
jgi:hypothetical protein